MLHTTVEYPYWYDSILVALVHDVPTWVCQLCGHRYFDPGRRNDPEYHCPGLY